MCNPNQMGGGPAMGGMGAAPSPQFNAVRPGAPTPTGTGPVAVPPQGFGRQAMQPVRPGMPMTNDEYMQNPPGRGAMGVQNQPAPTPVTPGLEPLFQAMQAQQPGGSTIQRQIGGMFPQMQPPVSGNPANDLKPAPAAKPMPRPQMQPPVRPPQRTLPVGMRPPAGTLPGGSGPRY